MNHMPAKLLALFLACCLSLGAWASTPSVVLEILTRSSAQLHDQCAMFIGDWKHWSKRIPGDQVEQVKADLEAGARFKDLCRQFADVTEEATIMDDQQNDKPVLKLSLAMLGKKRYP